MGELWRARADGVPSEYQRIDSGRVSCSYQFGSSPFCSAGTRSVQHIVRTGEMTNITPLQFFWTPVHIGFSYEHDHLLYCKLIYQIKHENRKFHGCHLLLQINMIKIILPCQWVVIGDARAQGNCALFEGEDDAVAQPQLLPSPFIRNSHVSSRLTLRHMHALTSLLPRTLRSSNRS